MVIRIWVKSCSVEPYALHVVGSGVTKEERRTPSARLMISLKVVTWAAPTANLGFNKEMFVWLSPRNLSDPPSIHCIGVAAGGATTFAAVSAGRSLETGALDGSVGGATVSGSAFALADDTVSSGPASGVTKGSTGTNACGVEIARDRFEASSIIATALSCISSPSPADPNHLTGFTVGLYGNIPDRLVDAEHGPRSETSTLVNTQSPAMTGLIFRRIAELPAPGT